MLTSREAKAYGSYKQCKTQACDRPNADLHEGKGLEDSAVSVLDGGAHALVGQGRCNAEQDERVLRRQAVCLEVLPQRLLMLFLHHQACTSSKSELVEVRSF